MPEKIDCIDLYHYKNSDKALRHITDRLLYRLTYITGEELEFIRRTLEDELGLSEEIIEKMAAERLERFEARMKLYEDESNNEK